MAVIVYGNGEQEYPGLWNLWYSCFWMKRGSCKPALVSLYYSVRSHRERFTGTNAWRQLASLSRIVMQRWGCTCGKQPRVYWGGLVSVLYEQLHGISSGPTLNLSWLQAEQHSMSALHSTCSQVYCDVNITVLLPHLHQLCMQLRPHKHNLVPEVISNIGHKLPQWALHPPHSLYFHMHRGLLHAFEALNLCPH